MTELSPAAQAVLFAWDDVVGRYSRLNFDELISEAFQAGADQELEACRHWLEDNGAPRSLIDGLLVARCVSEPPSLKEQALAALERYESEEWCEEMTFDSSVIRRALEALPNDCR